MLTVEQRLRQVFAKEMIGRTYCPKIVTIDLTIAIRSVQHSDRKSGCRSSNNGTGGNHCDVKGAG
jgi:hypothetical protein